MSADYGRVKRALRHLSLEESLIHLWHYSRLVCNEERLPFQYHHVDGRGMHMQLERYLFPHQLDLLGRELMLHADRSARRPTRSLALWEDLASAMNAIRYYGNAVFDGEKDGGVMLTLHRIAHQQFPRFSQLSASKIGRYLALYRFDALSPFFRRRIGIDVDSYFAIAFAVISASNQRPCSNRTTDYSILGVDPIFSEKFFSRIVGSAEEIRKKLISEQRLGDCWEYTFNALHFKPLVAFDAKHPERLICPLPHAVESRLTEGIFFDVFSNSPGFEKAYGDAIEHIVGRMLQSLPSSYSVIKPEKEVVGKLEFSGADWIIGDGIDKAYIECKAKRLALRGRVAEKIEDLQDEMRHLADAVLQNYRNIDRAIRRPDESNNTGSFFSIVVTLEDWILFSPFATEMLEKMVTEGLHIAGLPIDIRERIPYLIFGAESFQHAIAAMLSHSISDVLGGLQVPKYKGWVPSIYLQKRFADANTAVIGDFERDFKELVGTLLSEVNIRRAKGL